MFLMAKKQDLYTEEDEPNPLGVYGKSKLEGEQAALKILDDCLVFRVSWVIGKGQQNFLYKLTQWAKTQPQLKVSFDEVSIPTSAENIVNVTLQALDKGLKRPVSSNQYRPCLKIRFRQIFRRKDEPNQRNNLRPIIQLQNQSPTPQFFSPIQ